MALDALLKQNYAEPLAGIRKIASVGLLPVSGDADTDAGGRLINLTWSEIMNGLRETWTERFTHCVLPGNPARFRSALSPFYRTARF